MKVFISGTDSYIAKELIQHNVNWLIKGIARKKTFLTNEIILKDFFSVDESYLSEIEVMVNFAAVVHQSSKMDSGIYNKINYLLPIHLAQTAKSAGVKHFVQMSTIAVYGDREKIALTTDYAPNSPYGISKLMTDKALIAMQDDDFKVTIIRPSMVYGGGAAPGNMLKLINLANKRIPLPFKNVNNSRQFCHVGLLIEVLTRVVEQKKDGIFLVADKIGVSTFEILTVIERFLGKEVWQITPPKIFLAFLKKIKPLLYQKLYGSLMINCESSLNRLTIDRNKYSFQEGIQEMVKAFLE